MTPNPEVLAITIIEVDDDRGVYADGEKYVNEVLLFSTKPIAYTGKTVLCMPKCCRRQGGMRDRRRMDNEIAERGSKMQRNSRRYNCLKYRCSFYFIFAEGATKATFLVPFPCYTSWVIM